ncbi:HNH endonuclease [Sphingomonas sp.]|jgi:putative restriction endonuclease|uniref:HNH endonuclease n=1 Tax=Sphingomonas sp. TaxID=28214 RepID=UPI002E31CD23|nr:HNH endonuclease [Sphingomonas sp.]HEX4694286.1 HNH endonuclease [Sphingomonas sp.]
MRERARLVKSHAKQIVAAYIRADYTQPMSFGVFIHREDSRYDDTPAERYHFPRQYLDRARPIVGDWVVYYEPVKVPDSKGYFATAKVESIVPDASEQGMYYAMIEPGSYIDFPDPVPRADADGAVERDLINAQWAVRPLSPADFRRIVDRGLAEEKGILPRLDGNLADRVQDDRSPFGFEITDRPTTLVSRVVRDRAFRRVVLKAYGARCAITGLKLINGGGRAEVEAAHIRPVEAGGPDSLQNGLALSGTAHWMFDRGLIGLDDDLSILVSRQVNDPDGVKGMINSTGRALAPDRSDERPHAHYLRWHRENCFKH